MAAFFAAGAFLLSLLIGLISRNPFGVALLRALLLAVVFAGLGAGLRFVVKTYLPELAGAESPSADGGKSETRDGRGGRVDIVLPEERPPARQHAQGGEGSSLEDSPLGSFRDVDDDVTPGERAGSQAEAEVMENLAEELEEELPGASEGRDDSLGGDEATLGDYDLAMPGGGLSPDDMGVSGRSAVGGARAEKADRGGSRKARRGSDADDDSLPDISNLEILTDRGAGAPGVQPDGAGEETPEDAVRGAVSGQDPATLARAIRTVLKRDEKG